MRRDAIFAGTTAFATVLALLLWNQLRESNKLIAKLQLQVEELARAQNGHPVRPAAINLAQQPIVASVATPVAPVEQAAAADAGQPVPAMQPGCEATLTRVRQNAADMMARWATELQLTPDETQRITEVRQAQGVARSSCASTGGAAADPEQLYAQFLDALGPARLQQLLELNATRRTQTGMSYWGKQFKEKGTPLNDEQARQLRAIFLDENRRSEGEAARTFVPAESHVFLANQEKQLQLAEERLGRIQTAAQSFLSPEQVAQLRDNAAKEIDQRRSSLKSFREAVERGEKIGAQPSLLSIYIPPPQ